MLKGKRLERISALEADAFISAEEQRAHPGAHFRPEQARPRAKPPGSKVQKLRCAFSGCAGVQCRFAIRRILHPDNTVTIEDSPVTHRDHDAEKPKRGIKKTMRVCSSRNC